MTTDVFDPATRSAVMAKVRGRDTKPEMAVRRALHRLGYRYRLHAKDFPGAPDLLFPARGKAVFVHGCFWHGHECPRGSRMPKANADYWHKKIARNVERDAQAIAALEAAGWGVHVVWECALKEAGWLAKAQAFLEG